MKILYVSIYFIAITAPCFAQWTVLNSGTNKDLKSVYFIDNNTGYIVGNTGTILKTNNAGLTWINQSYGTSNDLRGVFFIDDSLGFIVGDTGTILKTINAGTTWTVENSGTSNSLKSVFFIDNNTGFAVGDSGTVIKTTDGGANWSLQAGVFSLTPFFAISFVNNNNGYIFGCNPLILKTIDGGNTWVVTGNEIFNCLTYGFFPTIDTGYAVGFNGKIFKTIDGGTNWTEQISGQNCPQCSFNSVFYLNANIGYIVGGNDTLSTIQKTVDGGSNWTTETFVGLGFFNSVHFTNDSTGYVVGNFGTIMKTNNNSSNINENQMSESSIVIYPNPIFNVLNIECAENTTIEILNSKGQVVKVTNRLKTKSVINFDGFPSGVYIIKAKSQNNTVIKKFIKG